MEEAIALGMEEAEKYGVNLKLTEVHSYDNDSERYIDAGEDGQRQWWYVSFANEELNYLDVLICNGELYRVQFFEANGNNGLIEIDDVQMTAQEAVQEAKEMGLRGGDPDNEEEEWVSGFNFKLEYASLASDPDNDIIFLEVIGISPNGNFAHVDFDAATGELLIVEEETADGWSEWGKTDVQDDDMEVEQETELYQVTPSEPGNEMLTALIDIGLEYQVLLATDKVYEDGVNSNASIYCEVYYLIDGEYYDLGKITSWSTAYPISYDEQYIYAVSNNSLECYTISENGSSLILYAQYKVDYSNDIYYCIKNEITETISEEAYNNAFDDYANSIVVNFY